MRKLFIISLLCVLGISVFGQKNDQKNILFIAVDDLKPLLSVYGHNEMHTPNFDRLAAMGATFTNAHVQYAVCGPSRASIMTGTFPDETKVWDLHTDFRESAPSLISMPEYLIHQGYETTAIGKIYHKGSSAEGHDGKSWSIPHQLPENYPVAYGEPAFSYYQNPETKARMTALTEEGQAKGLKGNGKLRNYVFEHLKPSTESADVPDAAYQDGLYTLAAIDMLEKLKAGDKPFFLGVGYQKPHLPFVAPQRYWDMYDRSKIDLSPFQELSEGTPQIAYHSFGELRAYSDIDNDLRQGDVLPEDKQRELIHGYMACVSYIDAQLGMLLDALEKKGLAENTVIVLWGDHGFHLGDHTLWCKHSNFEQATHIPLMFAGPGVEAGAQVSQPVNLVDVFPTLFELSGVTPSAQTTGKSLVPLLDGNDKTTLAQDYAISQYQRNKNNTMGYSLRTDRYRYTEWVEEFRSYQPYGKNKVSGVELYDYETDPNETRNLAGDPAYAKVVMEMKAKLLAHLAEQEKAMN
ncbi:sulfatase [Lewinella sp. LCG006]|uniref:sulfatase n=1 Tax=Lewinella sp. LCG006 TaxID=3231911 RepID=UPI0034610B0B